MKRPLFAIGAACIAWYGIGENIACAQFSGQLGQYSAPQVRKRSPVSPYINLMNPGGATAIDYYGIVRPQMDAQRSINNLQQGLSNLGDLNQPAAIQQTSANALGGMQTGHSATYFNYQNYFPNAPGTTGGSSTGAGFGSAGFGSTGSGNAIRPFFSSNLNSFR